MDRDRTYVACIGDIRASQQIEKRHAAQELLHETLEEINEAYGSFIAAKFIITLGDEFQGLLYDASSLFPIIEYIQLRTLGTLEFRFAVGIGRIQTSINASAAIGADGPAYHRARSMLTRMKEESREARRLEHFLLIDSGLGDIHQEMIEALLGLLAYLHQSWTEKQAEAVYTLNRFDGKQKDAAEALDIAQSSLQRRITPAGYYHYRRATETLTEYLITHEVPYRQ